MIQRQLDVNDDWTFGRGIQNFVTGQAAMMLNLKTRLREWANDCFFNLSAGIDYLNYLGIGKQSLLDNAIITVTLGSYGVISVDTYSGSLSSSERAYSVTMTLKTIYGTVTLSTDVGIPIGGSNV